MKTLIITLEYPPQIGGIASYVQNFIEHTKNEELVVYAPDVLGAKDYDKNNNLKVYRGRPYWRFCWPRWGRLLWDVWHIVKKEKVDKIYVHHALPVGYVAEIIKKFKKIPFTVFFHGTDLELGMKFKKNKLKKICRSAEKIVVNSLFLKEKILSNLDKNLAEKIIVLYPCPSDIFFTPVSEDKKKKLQSQLALGGKKVILTVARISDGKGYPHFLSILPEILKKIPNLVWVIVGDGPKKQAIMEQVQKNNLHNIVRFVGSVPHSELPVFYQSADLFVMLTHKDETTEEGWGTVFLEAASSGLPVVAGRAGGVEEAVQTGVTGYVFDVNKKNEIILNVINLLSDDNLSQLMGEQGKKRVQTEFVWDKQILNLN